MSDRCTQLRWAFYTRLCPAFAVVTTPLFECNPPLADGKVFGAVDLSMSPSPPGQYQLRAPDRWYLWCDLGSIRTRIRRSRLCAFFNAPDVDASVLSTKAVRRHAGSP